MNDPDPRSTTETLPEPSQAEPATDSLAEKIVPDDGQPPDPPEHSTSGDVSGSAEDWVEEEVEVPVEGTNDGSSSVARTVRVRRRRRMPKADAIELRLRGRREMCATIPDLAPKMLKTVKLRILGRYLPSVRGLEDDDLTNTIKAQAAKLADRARILAAVRATDPDNDRHHLKAIIFAILLQEETHSLEENRLDAKVIEFEKELVKQSKTLDFTELKRSDPQRWHHYDTYRVVLEAAWSNDGTISPDEARLLGVLRNYLDITLEGHWQISALIKRFPKDKSALHTPDEVNEARKELQREGVLWNYRDENNRNIDVIPAEVVGVLRRDVAGLELQRTNFRRLMNHDAILLTDLRNIASAHGLDRSGNKPDLIERIVASNIKPSEVLAELERPKLAEMCGSLGLRTSGNKPDFIERLIDFYDDLTFEEHGTKDGREVWYNDLELLAARAYAELRAKKLIAKDLDIEHQFEAATEFLFQSRLNVPCDRSQKDSRSDGRLPLDGGQCLLWDCKSAEGPVNLQDHLDGQFDGYLRKERDAGRQPLAFLVIAPSFTPQSIKLAHQYKARTNWDVALVTAAGLKHLADRWAAAEPGKPFPIRLFNRTEVIDVDRAEFLLSLA